ncbi:MAG: hypothetical protein LBE13_05405 [Bacteroidales bacterium]|jgi:hypothetical protein|nr:hypothetical protein [Bacteroidales bacterium]
MQTQSNKNIDYKIIGCYFLLPLFWSIIGTYLFLRWIVHPLDLNHILGLDNDKHLPDDFLLKSICITSIGFVIVCLIMILINRLRCIRYFDLFYNIVKFFVRSYIALFYMGLIPFIMYQYFVHYTWYFSEFHHWSDVLDCYVELGSLLGIYILFINLILFSVVGISFFSIQQCKDFVIYVYKRTYNEIPKSLITISIDSIKKIFLNIFRWTAIVFLISSIPFSYFMMETIRPSSHFLDTTNITVDQSAWGGLLFAMIIETLSLILLGTGFAAIMYGIYQMIKQIIIFYYKK